MKQGLFKACTLTALFKNFNIPKRNERLMQEYLFLEAPKGK